MYLRDIATIELKNKEPENIVRVNGKRCMGIAVYKETSANTVNAVDEFFVALETLKKSLPGYEFTVIRNQGRFVTSAINEVKQSALIGVLLAVIVLGCSSGGSGRRSSSASRSPFRSSPRSHSCISAASHSTS